MPPNVSVPVPDALPLGSGPSTSTRAWRITAVAMVALSLVVVGPFLPWLVLASWFARAARPALTRLAKRMGGRGRAATVLTLGLLVAVCGPVVAVGASLTVDAITLGRRLAESGSGREALALLVSRDDVANGEDIVPDAASVLDMIEQHGQQALAIVSTVAGTTLELALGLFVFFSAAYFLLVEDNRVRAFVSRYSPIDAAHGDRIDHAFHETGRGLFVGIGLAALAQATVATIAYAALGVPRALVLGFVTLLASLIPSVGTALVWLPVSIALAVTGKTTEAIILAAVGVVIVGSIDNVLRPFLTRFGHLELHPFVVLVSMLGGLALIGGWGLVMGPLVVRLTAEVLKITSERELV